MLKNSIMVSNPLCFHLWTEWPKESVKESTEESRRWMAPETKAGNLHGFNYLTSIGCNNKGGDWMVN